MKNKFISFIIAFYLINSLQAQTTFTRLYGDTSTEAAFSICQSKHDNGYVFTGRSVNLFVTKINSIGDTVWTRFLGVTNNSQGCSVTQTADSGFAVAGFYNSTPLNTDIVVLKLNKSGAVQWTKTYDIMTTDIPRSIAQGPDGGFFITGYVNNTIDQIFLLRLNKVGNIKWSKVYASNLERHGMDIALTSDGEVAIAGDMKDSLSGLTDFIILKTDTANGTRLWSSFYPGTASNGFTSVFESAGNELVLGGITEEFTIGLRAAVFAKFDLLGTELILEGLGDCASTLGNDIAQTAAGDFVLAGYTLPCGGFSLNGFLIKVDNGGNYLWNKMYSSLTGISASFCMTKANDGGFVLAGDEQGMTSDDINVTKTDANGNVSCPTNTMNVTTQIGNPGFYPISFTTTTAPTTATTIAAPGSKTISITTQCLVLSTNSISENKISINIYPNPTLNNLNIDVEKISFDNSEIEITNNLRQPVLKLKYSKEINVSNLAEGYYNLNVITPTQVYHTKFVKQH